MGKNNKINSLLKEVCCSYYGYTALYASERKNKVFYLGEIISTAEFRDAINRRIDKKIDALLEDIQKEK